jgi:hypothetical protein
MNDKDIKWIDDRPAKKNKGDHTHHEKDNDISSN